MRILVPVLILTSSGGDIAGQTAPTSKPLGTVFDDIYANGSWGKDSKGRGTSGFGSTLEFTHDYRAYLEEFIKSHKVKSVVDAGCGDWEFASAIDWNHAQYLGVDISARVVAQLKEKYASKTVRFKVGDATESLPAADLLICKDVLQHLPNALVQKFIRNNLRKGKYKWAIITNDRDSANHGPPNADISAGSHRGIDLSAPPFNVKGLVDVPVNFHDPYHKLSQMLDLR
jgi:SAM-dependent methyltransferase